MDLTTERMELGEPIKECRFTLKIPSASGSNEYLELILDFPTRFSLWYWLRLFRVAKLCWGGKRSADDLPVWTTDIRDRSITFPLAGRFDNTVLIGRWTLSLDMPHIIQVEKEGEKIPITVDITYCTNLSFSPNSLPWRPIRLQIDRVIAVSAAASTGSSVIVENNKNRRHLTTQVTEFTKSTISEISTTATGTLRKITAGDTPALIADVQYTIAEVGSTAEDIARRGANIAFGLNGQMNCFILLRSGGCCHKLPSIKASDSFIWLESFGFDFPSDHDEGDRKNNNKVRKIDDSVEILCFKGEPGLESVVSNGKVSLHNILTQLQRVEMTSSLLYNSEDRETNLRHPSGSAIIMLDSISGNISYTILTCYHY
jgi:hypothetical protein